VRKLNKKLSLKKEIPSIEYLRLMEVFRTIYGVSQISLYLLQLVIGKKNLKRLKIKMMNHFI